MSDFHPQIVLIEKIDKHPNADNLSIATVLNGYPVIFKTGDYSIGDVAAWICIDSVVADTEQFHFMSPTVRDIDGKLLGYKYEVGAVPEKYRIVKAKKIRGIFSMGLLVKAPDGLSVGDSIIERFGLIKWEEPDEEIITNPKVRFRNEKKPVGWSIPYYDMNSVRKFGNLFLPDEPIVLLEKDHGCNFSACFDGKKLWVKSRSLFKANEVTFKDGDGVEQTVLSNDHWTEAARRYNLEEKLAKFPMKVLYSECVGQVGGYPYDSKIVDGKRESTLHFFDVYDPIEERYLDYEDSLEIILSAGLTPSKELYKGPWLGKEIMCPMAEGKSSWNDKHLREGWVMKPLKERMVDRIGRWQLKCVSEGYSLSK